MSVLRRAVNQRRDSIEQFTKAGRFELVTPEQEELVVLEMLLPTQLPREEIEHIARAKLTEFGTLDKASVGKFMGSLMQELKGRADGNDVKAVVESLIS
jgi:uncharacterized protein YqeY